MSPSELHALVIRTNDAIRSATIGASSLVLLAVGTAIAGYGMHRIGAPLTKTLTTFAALGVVILIVASLFLRWRREELYDDTLLQGLRHVHPTQVTRRAAQLVSRGNREQMADALDHFVEVASANRRMLVPVHRVALKELHPQVTQLSEALRSDRLELEPAGMVLLQRFITDGAASPLYRPSAPTKEIERELDRIRRTLSPPW